MKPSEILKSEHRVIEQVLSCLERLSDQSQRNQQLDAQAARDAIDFFRNFADGCHHGKEEKHFFPAMEAAGFPRDGGPTGVMFQEHEIGREHIRAMDRAVEAASNGNSQAIADFVSHAREYVALLREHIAKEDHCLFTMADQTFTEEDQAELLRRFEHVEANEMGEGTHDRYLEIAHRLAKQFDVTPVESSGGCCGHH